MILSTPRLRLRPLLRADIPAMTARIFADWEVMSGLFHDVSTPALQAEWGRRWCEAYAQDGTLGGADTWAMGVPAAFAIEAGPALKDAAPNLPKGFLGMVGFDHITRNEEGLSAEIFYALASPAHGRGLMSEAAAAALDTLKGVHGPLSVHGFAWAQLNPASIRLMERLGLAHAGPQTLLAEYPEQRIMGILAFELTRLRATKAAERARFLRPAALKAGHIAYEGLTSPAEALVALQEAAPEADAAALEAWIAEGAAAPGLALLRWSRA